MGLFSRFEDKAEDVFEGSAHGGLEPVKIAKRAAKEMQREKMVGVGHEYAPTLYNVLVSIEDDRRMGGYYPSLAGEIQSYLTSRAQQANLVFDCTPLVRFIVDEGLKRGKFDVIAESVSPTIIEELRREEMEHYGLDSRIDINPELRQSTSPAPEDYGQMEEFDPFMPADMQSAVYIPEDSPARKASMPLSAQQPEQPAAAVTPQPTSANSWNHQQEAAAANNVAVVNPAFAEDEEDTAAFRASAIPNGARVCLYDYESGRRYPLAGTSVTIGRGADNDIRIADAGASRHHAEFVFANGTWMVRDNNSTNGTFINGEPVTQHILYNNDVVEMGTTRLEFRED